MFSPESYFPDRGEYADINDKVAALASHGEDAELIVPFYSARFACPADETIDTIILRAGMDPSRSRTVIINYTDNTSYEITFKNDQPWSFSHSDDSQAEGENLERLLRFGNGVKRIDYISSRFSGDISQDNLADSAMPALVDANAAGVAIDGLVSALLDEEERYGQIRYKEIDPADVDLTAMLAPIFTLRPENMISLRRKNG